jgi:hypothetical protein
MPLWYGRGVWKRRRPPPVAVGGVGVGWPVGRGRGALLRSAPTALLGGDVGAAAAAGDGVRP